MMGGTTPWTLTSALEDGYVSAYDHPNEASPALVAISFDTIWAKTPGYRLERNQRHGADHE